MPSAHCIFFRSTRILHWVRMSQPVLTCMSADIVFAGKVRIRNGGTLEQLVVRLVLKCGIFAGGEHLATVMHFVDDHFAFIIILHRKAKRFNRCFGKGFLLNGGLVFHRRRLGCTGGWLCTATLSLVCNAVDGGKEQSISLEPWLEGMHLKSQE